jgi:hypothetical protein
MCLPYPEFEDTALWKVVNAALAELEKNGDVKLSTAKENVVGYLCQQIAQKKLVTDGSILRD